MNAALEPTLLSLGIAAAATLVVVVPAFVVGLLLARKDFPGKALVETLVTLPLVLPPTATGLVLLLLLGKQGPLAWLDVVFTWKGAVIATAIVSFPLVARTARVAFEGVDPRLEQMAASLGFSRARVKWTVTLPLAGRGLVAAAVLGFARALGEFGATVMVAGSIPGRTRTLALAIFEEMSLGEERRALVLVGISVVLAFGAIAVAGRLQRRDPGEGAAA